MSLKKTLDLCDELLLLHRASFADHPSVYQIEKPQCTAAKAVHTMVGNTKGTLFCFDKEGNIIKPHSSIMEDDILFKTYAINQKNAIRKFNQYLKNKQECL